MQMQQEHTHSLAL